MGYPHRQRGRSIGDVGGASTDVSQRGHTVEGPYNYQVVCSIKYDTTGVPGGPPNSGTELDHYDPPTKSAGSLYGHQSGGGDL